MKLLEDDRSQNKVENNPLQIHFSIFEFKRRLCIRLLYSTQNKTLSSLPWLKVEKSYRGGVGQCGIHSAHIRPTQSLGAAAAAGLYWDTAAAHSIPQVPTRSLSLSPAYDAELNVFQHNSTQLQRFCN